MTYTLITKTGTIMRFYVLGAAELYKTLHGGVIVTENDVNSTEINDEKVQ
jgi:hypothetical protein